MMKKVNVVVILLAMVVIFPMSSMAKEKKYIIINDVKYVRCQPIKGFSGKPVKTDASVGAYWLIKMKPHAVWNGKRCIAEEGELLFNAYGKPIENRRCRNEIVWAEKVQQKIVAKDACEDIPWDADGIWADFPEGATGSETQLRNEGPRYKYKLVTRKSDNKIHAIKCFKKENIWSLADLSARWGVKLSTFKTFGNKGDGGNLATLVIGIVK